MSTKTYNCPATSIKTTYSDRDSAQEPETVLSGYTGKLMTTLPHAVNGHHDYPEILSDELGNSIRMTYM